MQSRADVKTMLSTTVAKQRHVSTVHICGQIHFIREKVLLDCCDVMHFVECNEYSIVAVGSVLQMLTAFHHIPLFGCSIAV